MFQLSCKDTRDLETTLTRLCNRAEKYDYKTILRFECRDSLVVISDQQYSASSITTMGGKATQSCRIETDVL